MSLNKLCLLLFLVLLAGCSFAERRTTAHVDPGPDGVFGTNDDITVYTENPSDLEVLADAVDPILAMTPWAAIGGLIGLLASGVSSIATEYTRRAGS